MNDTIELDRFELSDNEIGYMRYSKTGGWVKLSDVQGACNKLVAKYNKAEEYGRIMDDKLAAANAALERSAKQELLNTEAFRLLGMNREKVLELVRHAKAGKKILDAFEEIQNDSK